MRRKKRTDQSQDSCKAEAEVRQSLQTPRGAMDDMEVRSSKSLQLSALFTAMMESNAMLREEIDQMEGTPELKAAELSAAGDDESHRSHRENRSHSRQQLHSQSLPARLLENSERLPTTLTTSNASSISPQAATSRGQKNIYRISLGSESSESEDTESQETDEEGDSSMSPVCHGEPLRGLQSPLLTQPPLSITSVSSTELTESDYSETSPEPENDAFASPGESTIETMWDNFSVEEYAPPQKHKVEAKPIVKKLVVKTVWTRRVTIPEPFAMTIRDQAKPKRRKSRALIAAEREKLEREMQEELECQKKFRALPVPATTYVPADEIRRPNQDQHGQSRYEKIAQPIKPFSFMKREEEKRLQQQRQSNGTRGTKETVQFRAKPAPQSILSPRVSEELKEREEYRQILIKVRSQEMLARAQLPKNMHEKQKRDSLRKQRLEEMQNKAFVTKEHTFRPKIRTDVPDHNQLYCQFQQQMAAKKDVKLATTPKPFVLRTASTPSRCVHPHNEEGRYSVLEPSCHTAAKSNTHGPNFERYSKSHTVHHTKEPTSGPKFELVRHSRSTHHTREPTVPMTETAKLRRSGSERKLAESSEREAEGEEARRLKREDQRELQSRVIQRVQSYDRSAWLQERQRERLQELRSVL